MQQQAEALGHPLSDLRLGDIEPDRDLPRGIRIYCIQDLSALSAKNRAGAAEPRGYPIAN